MDLGDPLAGLAALGLSGAEATALAAHCRSEHHPSGATILRRGDVGDSLYLIAKGQVRCPVRDEEGEERETFHLGAGEVFGEISLLTGQRRTVDVIADGAVDCLVVPRQPLEALLARQPELARFLTTVLGERLTRSRTIRSVGKYRILDELGRGGMAIVYEGVHPGLSRTVAIKMLSHALAYDRVFVERFRNEARIIAALDHPNIVRVYDVEEAYATCFIVMEKLVGTTLDRVLSAHGRLPLRRARSILLRLARALDFAHQRGIVHRDVKPSNIALSPDGGVKLMDFGIAHAQGLPEDPDLIPGTLEYMAPEVAQGHPAGPRSDVYSLGVMAYEMVTGQLPFTVADDPTRPTLAVIRDLARLHREAPLPSPRALRPDLPEDLLQLIVRATAKRPEDRFAGCSEVAELLQGAGANEELERIKVRQVALVYGPGLEREIETLLEQLAAAAAAIPGVKLIRS